MTETAYSEILPDNWLAGILGYDAYRVSLSRETSGGTGLPAVLREGAVFAYAKVHPSDIANIIRLEDMGFRLIDTNITFDKPIDTTVHTPADQCIVRFAEPEDEEPVVELARRSFHFSRFHLDPGIPTPIANTIKAEWVRNYFFGQRGHAMVIAEVDGVIAGFIQLLKQQETLIIDLIAVDDAYRRKHIGSDMISFAEKHAGECSRLVVGTQLANIPSMRLYEKSGFRIAGASYVFHYHHRV